MTCLAVTVILLSFAVVAESKGSMDIARATYLHEHYDRNTVPVKNVSHPLTVYLGISIRKILEVEEFEQLMTVNVWVREYWKDEFIHWEPSDVGGRKSIWIDHMAVWLPDIALYTDGAGNYNPSMPIVQVIVSHAGNVLYMYPAVFKVACRMDIMYFPFDQQRCQIELGSWAYDASVIDLQLVEDNAAAYVDYKVNTAWQLINFTARQKIKTYGCCKDLLYPTNIFELTIRRHWSIHFFYMLMPSILIQFLAVLQFLLPCDSGEKVSLGITIYLSMLVYLLMVSEMLPSTEEIPYIVRYIVSTLMMVAVAQMLTIIVLMIHHNGSHDNHSMLPHWARILFLHCIARALCMAQYITSDDEHQYKLCITATESVMDIPLNIHATKPPMHPNSKPNKATTNRNTVTQTTKNGRQLGDSSLLIDSSICVVASDAAAASDRSDGRSALQNNAPPSAISSPGSSTAFVPGPKTPADRPLKTPVEVQSPSISVRPGSSANLQHMLEKMKTGPDESDVTSSETRKEKTDSEIPNANANCNTDRDSGNKSQNYLSAENETADPEPETSSPVTRLCHVLEPSGRCQFTNSCENCHTQCSPAFMCCSESRNLCKCQVQRNLDQKRYEYIMCCCKCVKKGIEEESCPWLVPIKCQNHYELIAREFDKSIKTSDASEMTLQDILRNRSNCNESHPSEDFDGQNWNNQNVSSSSNPQSVRRPSHQTTRQRRMEENKLSKKSSYVLEKDMLTDNMNKLLYKISKRLADFKQCLADKDVDMEVKCEWQQVAMVLDRLMFVVFTIGTLVVLLIMYCSIPWYSTDNIEDELHTTSSGD